MREENGYVNVEEGVRLFYRILGAGAFTVIPNGFYFLEEFKSLANLRTLVFYDVRNRGLSDPITDPTKLSSGIFQDIEDLEKLRKGLNLSSFEVIGHSYIGLMVMLYAQKYADSISRAIVIGATQPDASKNDQAQLTNDDGVTAEVFSQLKQIPKKTDPIEACKQFWSILRRIYVYKSEDAEKIDWGRCDLSNERNFMKYWTDHLFPSMQNVHLNEEKMRNVQAPVLVIHGDRDRSVPYGAALEWARILPDARLLTFHHVAHAPWIEAPQTFFEAVQTFLSGNWPESAESIRDNPLS